MKITRLLFIRCCSNGSLTIMFTICYLCAFIVILCYNINAVRFFFFSFCLYVIQISFLIEAICSVCVFINRNTYEKSHVFM